MKKQNLTLTERVQRYIKICEWAMRRYRVLEIRQETSRGGYHPLKYQQIVGAASNKYIYDVNNIFHY